MAIDRLGPLDAAFLLLEDADPRATLAVAAVAVIDGPAPTPAELRAIVRPIAAAVPRARQRVRRAFADAYAPTWVDDPDFDPDTHVFRACVPRLGGDAELGATVAAIMARRLPRNRPLWECWAVEGLADGSWALVLKVHHCVADGMSGMRLYQDMFSSSPTSVPRRAQPGTGITDLVAQRIGGALSLASALVPTSPSTLIGPIGDRRRYRPVRLSLPDVRRVATTFATTVNDVLLAAVAGGLRTLLLHRGEPLDANAVRALVPVSTRAHAVDGAVDNQLSLMLPMLPVHLGDPVDLLSAVHRATASAKRQGTAAAGRSAVSLAAALPHPPLAWALRCLARLPQHNVVTVASGIPGPRHRMELFGRTVRALYPYVPIALRMRTAIGMLSYDDQVCVGITADHDTVPDVAVLAAGIEHTAGALRTAADGFAAVVGGRR
ncbi:wax ester/triacylglycerol synthase domain-containing protein [Actinokineospora fastidiosa]|uniref:diacylglycerol O-acyltransferase n=1 Tax=Actinokineospora fastidiosa TaxID=1816 RepID=A0A918LC21_9PSEU|nr:wax ester/triacylglycerol synthase domain-containing protein [Actinokineospora fastidiosa]GGS28709.1 putative diacyglycerol O-acyltransferase [Actinokineospora fastidiosa]